MSDFKGIRRDRLKLRFLKPEGKISRRELLKLLVPRYEVVPFIETALCRGSRECGLCLDSCPLKAIKVDEDKVTIEPSSCSGCGACIIACPQRAIVYPTYSLEQLDEAMEGLLIAQGTHLEPRMIALVCKNCLPLPGEDKANQATYPSNVSSLKIPCLAMASPWLMLRAFDRGASGLALIAGRRKCPVKFDANRCQETVRFVQGLLGCWDIEPGRVKVFDLTEKDSHNIEQELAQFAGEVAGLGPTRLGIAEPTLVPGDGLLLPALIKSLANKLGGTSKGVVTAGMVPFGKLELDSSECTGCGLCALDCPTGALTDLSNDETAAYQLLFQHDWCVACGRCVRICPEKCLHLEHILELDSINSPAAILFEDKIAHCRECGSIIGSRAMIARVRAKVLVMGESLASQLELCPRCKIMAPKSIGWRQDNGHST